MFRKIITFRPNPFRRQDFGGNPRDNRWLKERFLTLKNRYFPDLEVNNNLIIKFGRPTKTRLGSIKHGRRKTNPNTIITLNGHFQDREVPDFVIDSTILHEVTHYSQGWFSPHPQKYYHPHQGGVLKRELTDRGLSDTIKLSRKWLKQNWLEYLKKHHR